MPKEGVLVDIGIESDLPRSALPTSLKSGNGGKSGIDRFDGADPDGRLGSIEGDVALAVFVGTSNELLAPTDASEFEGNGGKLGGEGNEVPNGELVALDPPEEPKLDVGLLLNASNPVGPDAGAIAPGPVVFGPKGLNELPGPETSGIKS
jgi:hypothetical protein